MGDWTQPLIALAAVIGLTAGVWSAGHALLNKRDPRAAFGWMLLCLSLAYVGPLIYILFGINRISRQTRQIGEFPASAYSRTTAESRIVPDGASVEHQWVRISDRVAHRPMIGGNLVVTYFDMEQAYAEMLAAIGGASRCVCLASYIFRSDATGRRFVDTLKAAVARGVTVYVLVDGVGERYSWPPITRLLARAGIRHARFIPLRLVPPSLHVNLRNHRKLLIVDGRMGFTGGLNIGGSRKAMIDAHFRLTGPIVTQLAQVFAEDWHFATGEHIDLAPPPDNNEPAGPAACRTITDGPDDDIGKLALIIEAAISAARKSVRIMTPYFLPRLEMIVALKCAALRGVTVDIVLPVRSNLPYVDWATRNLLEHIIKWDVNVYYQPPPFAHSKLLVIDDRYSQIGSANMDPRSLRLNFEIAVEVLDDGLALQLARHFDATVDRSERVSLQDVQGRSLPARIRDSIAWLFSPYL